MLRLLALWVSRAYQEGFQGAHKDPLIGLGTAPLDDPMFRSALFEQLGENKLEGATFEQASWVLWVVIIIAVIPWRHVLTQYVMAPGEPWRRSR